MDIDPRVFAIWFAGHVRFSLECLTCIFTLFQYLLLKRPDLVWIRPQLLWPECPQWSPPQVMSPPIPASCWPLIRQHGQYKMIQKALHPGLRQSLLRDGKIAHYQKVPPKHLTPMELMHLPKLPKFLCEYTRLHQTTRKQVCGSIITWQNFVNYSK